MKKFLVLMAVMVLACFIASAEKFEPALYAFFNGIPRMSYEEEAAFLKKHGYAGISQIYAGEAGNKLEDRVKAYEKEGVKVLSVYLPATKDPVREEVVKGLSMNGGMIELTVKSIDKEVIESIRETSTMAEKLKIKVALYPHAGFAVETMPQAMELISRVNHPNLGVMFNLCHFLKSEHAEDLEKVLDTAGERLFAVSTCGADSEGANWGQLIQTLDKGSFSQQRLFTHLKKMNFRGPVGLQCHALKGDRKENLKASVKAWQKIVKEVNATSRKIR